MLFYRLVSILPILIITIIFASDGWNGRLGGRQKILYKEIPQNEMNLTVTIFFSCLKSAGRFGSVTNLFFQKQQLRGIVQTIIFRFYRSAIIYFFGFDVLNLLHVY